MEPFSRCTVVTPTFNSEAFLDETIASVVLQAAPGVAIDYHIQDGGSTDATAAIVAAWIERLPSLPRLAGSVRLTWASAPDGGMYDAINTGFAALAPAPQDLVTWINSDDRLAPGAIATVAQVFADHPECEFVSGRTALLNEAGSIVSITYPQAYARGALAAGRHDGRTHPFIMQEGTFFTGRVWAAVGGVDASFRLAGDWDLWRRMAREAAHFSIDTVTAFHRRRAGQLSADMNRYHGEVDGRSTEPPAPVADTPPQLIRYDADAGRWIRTPFDALASRPPLAVIDGRRRRSCAVSFLAGFGAPEGPYPEYRLPAGIRWLREANAEIAVEAPYDGAFRLALTLRPTAPELRLWLFANGVPLAEIALAAPVPDTDQLVAVSAWLGVGRNVIELEVVGEGEGPRLLLLVGCTAIAEPDAGQDAPHEAAPPGGELLRAMRGMAVVVSAAGNPTRLAETLASVREPAGPGLFVRVEPNTDAAGVVEALAPYARMLPPGDAWQERVREAGYRTALAITEGDRLRAGALADAHRALRDRAAVAGLVELVDDAGLPTRQLVAAADEPVLHDLAATEGGVVRTPLRLAVRRGGEHPTDEPVAARVWVVDDPQGWHPARPLLALAGALRMLGLDARHTLGAPGGGGVVIAAAGVAAADAADFVATVTGGELRLQPRGGGAAVALPRAIDAQAFRPRARGPARAALGLPADGFLVLADPAALDAVRRAIPAEAQLAVISAGEVPGAVALPPTTDPDTLAHLLSACDAAVAPRDSWLALAASACGVPTLDPEGAFVLADATGEAGPGLAPGLRRLLRGRAIGRLQAAEARASVERAATLEALALTIRSAAIPGLAGRDWLDAGAVALPTDAPVALEPLQVAQHSGFALFPLAGATVESDPDWSRVIRLDAAEAVLLLRVEDIAGTALRLHLTGPEASAWSIALDDNPPVAVHLNQPVTAARVAAPLAPGLHRVTIRAANPAAQRGGARIVAWEVVSTRASPDAETIRTRLMPVPLSGREIETLVADGDWRPGEGFLKPEAPHPAAGLWTPFRWTQGERATFRIRLERGGARTIDLAVTGIAVGQRLRLVADGGATDWGAPLAAYVGRVSHARWQIDWPAGELDVAIELADRPAGGNPRNLGILLLGIALS